MKLNKLQLKRIIREEKAKLIAETKIRRLVRRKLREQAADQLFFSGDAGGGGSIYQMGQKPHVDKALYTYSWSEDVLYEDPNDNADERAATFQKIKQTIEQYGDVLNGATYEEELEDGMAGPGDSVMDFIFRGLTNGDDNPSNHPVQSPKWWSHIEQWMMTTQLEW
jgi:hypothetical protein